MLILDEQYWSNRYSSHTHTWDAGRITTPLKDYIDKLSDKNISILIPGCGNSYEAEYLLQNGFSDITLLDMSVFLCRQLQEKLKQFSSKQLQIICTDFFEHDGQYDLIIEQTFFCALNPTLRKAYADKMHDLLKPVGKLAGLLFNRAFEHGPPFGGSEKEYRELFEPCFVIQTMELCVNSIEPRKGSELFIELCKK